MSKNITIQEGGVGRQFTADKLKTALVGGGSCLWVPEDETTLGAKTITENGTYRAGDDGYYGFSEVTVNGIGIATGTGPDGETHSYTEDGEGGITDKVLPDSIAVTTLPTVTTYADGDTIDFSGMVVTAYLKSGEVWSDDLHPNGIIPIRELILPVTTADKDESHSDEWSDGDGINAMLIVYTKTLVKYWDSVHQRPDPSRDYYVYIGQVTGEKNDLPAMYGSSGGATQFYVTLYNDYMYVWGSTSNRKLNTYVDTGREYERYSLFVGTSASTGTGQLIKYSEDSWMTELPESTKAPTGNESLSPVAAYQSIPVRWIRPGDGAALAVNFDITVT